MAIDIRRERESKSLQHCVLRYTGAKYRFWGEIPVKILVRLPVPVPSPTKEHLCTSSWQAKQICWRFCPAAGKPCAGAIHSAVLFCSILSYVLPLQEVALRQSPPSFSVLCCPCPYRSLLPHNVISPTMFWSSD